MTPNEPDSCNPAGKAVNDIKALVFLVAIFMCLACSACDTASYENSSLSGCYALNNEIFNQFWFDGTGEFEEIYWNAVSGTVSYGGKYYVSQNEIYLEYYGYDPEVYTLYIYPSSISIGGGSYYWIGDGCM